MRIARRKDSSPLNIRMTLYEPQNCVLAIVRRAGDAVVFDSTRGIAEFFVGSHWERPIFHQRFVWNYNTIDPPDSTLKCPYARIGAEPREKLLVHRICTSPNAPRS